MQAATPGLKLVTRFIRYIGDRIIPGRFQVSHRFHYAIGFFFAATADEK